MTYRIPSKELLGHEIALDEQIKVDHVNCPAGRDTRKRLHIKRIAVSAYIGHCFNCGGNGYHFSKDPARLEDRISNREPKLPHLGYSSYHSDGSTTLPLHVQKYLLDYGVTPKEAVDILRYRYLVSIDALVMPFFQYNTINPNDALQLRYMNSSNSRYQTRIANENITRFSLLYKATTKVVLVEDQISAYRVYRDLGITVIALLGTNLSDEVSKYLTITQPLYVYIWLDDDDAGKKAAIEIVKTLAPLLGAGIKVIIESQPKDLTVDQLKDAAIKWMT